MSTSPHHADPLSPSLAPAERARQAALDRRGFLSNVVTGLGGVALADLLSRDARSAEAKQDSRVDAPGPHFQPRAKRVLQIFCPGAASHMDLWEHKPALEKHHGKPLPGADDFVSFQGKNGNLMASPWPLLPAGESGKRISSLLPHMAAHVDDIAFLHAMTSRTNTHGPGCIYMNTGFVTEGFPSAGSWVTFALGSLNDDLPAYVAIPDIRGEPPNGKANWNNGFLPAKYQAINLSAQSPIRNLATPEGISPAAERATRELVGRMNRRYAERTPAGGDLAARIAAFELAARMQTAAPAAASFADEPAHVTKLYGADDPNPLKAAYARNCLLARRLLERNVRYVNLYCASRASGVDGFLNWDAHKTLKADYERHCPVFDQPTAALLTDLKRRGLLEDTVVVWATEFGRMPTHQQGTSGRDHNPDGFSCWLMGAGIKGGISYGATDEFGRRAVENVTTVYDLYATVLHLLGLDHQKLSYYHNGVDRRLTDVHGHVLREVLA
jgi:uncharacterized protein (DUF1501 family)